MTATEPLSAAARAALRAVARSAVERAVTERAGISVGGIGPVARGASPGDGVGAGARGGAAAEATGLSTELSRIAGAFVTLTIRGRLRGCIGRIEAEEPVAVVVAAAARAAALDDPRFPPVALAELGAIEIEVSVLGPRRKIAGPHELEIGADGLIVTKGRRSGLLLPQVAAEHGFGREAFLAETCVKAGLARDAWREGAEIFAFRAEVF